MKHSTNTTLANTWWRDGLAILCAVLGQVLLSGEYLWSGLAAYGAAIELWLQSTRVLKNNTRAPVMEKAGAVVGQIPAWKLSSTQRKVLVVGLQAACVNVVVTLVSDAFTWAGVIAWGISVLAFAAAFWESELHTAPVKEKSAPPLWVGVSFAAIVLLGVFFRIWQLRTVPPDMTWDHTQKLLDVRDIVEWGLRPIFFPRNTGREPLQFYWTALLVWLTGQPVGFTILKLGTVLVGVLTLPGIYLLATELYGPSVGVCAMGFAAVASWPVILSRMGLRFPLAPLFSAWAFYFLIRGLRRGERNSFVLLGVCLGAGLYGYTAFRVVPVAIGYTWLALNVTEGDSPLRANLSWRNFGIVVALAAVVFVPLGVFALVHGDDFWGRSTWYLRGLTKIAPLVFLENLKDALLMFNWRGDMMPLNTLPYAPVLDPVLGGLFMLGTISALRHAIHKTGTLTFALLLLGLSALLPSTLAINFANENPSVVRTSCTIPVVFTLAALPVGAWLADFPVKVQSRASKRLVYATLFGLTGALIAVNAHRVFVQYPATYRATVTNTGEIANVIRCFDAQIDDVTNAYVVGQGWINDDALAFELGLRAWYNTLAEVDGVNRDAAGARLYILHPDDEHNLKALQTLFPSGLAHTYGSQYDKDFVVFLVPSTDMPDASLETQVTQITTCAARDP